MAKSVKLMPSLRRTHQSLSIFKLFNTTKQNPSLFTSKLHPVSQITTTESCVSEIRKAAFEDNIRREIQYELQHSSSKQISGLMQPSSTQNWRSSQSSSSSLIVKREIGADILTTTLLGASLVLEVTLLVLEVPLLKEWKQVRNAVFRLDAGPKKGNGVAVSDSASICNQGTGTITCHF